EHIAINKIKAFDNVAFSDKLVITADRVVVCGTDMLGKPRDAAEAVEMLSRLQGGSDKVRTAVALQYQGELRAFVEETAVTFYSLSAEEIHYYIDRHRPFDKAGSYGIQEWIGFIGISSITGSYENVVGLPTARLYQEVKKL